MHHIGIGLVQSIYTKKEVSRTLFFCTSFCIEKAEICFFMQKTRIFDAETSILSDFQTFFVTYLSRKSPRAPRVWGVFYILSLKQVFFRKIGVFRTLRILKYKRTSLLKKYFSRAIIILKNQADISKQKTPA
jgi:hypothetical protein